MSGVGIPPGALQSLQGLGAFGQAGALGALLPALMLGGQTVTSSPVTNAMRPPNALVSGSALGATLPAAMQSQPQAQTPQSSNSQWQGLIAMLMQKLGVNPNTMPGAQGNTPLGIYGG